MILKTYAKYSNFLQICKKFVFFYKKLNNFKHIAVVLNVLLFLCYNLKYNTIKKLDFFFFINYFKLFFRNYLKNNIINNFFFKHKSSNVFYFNSVLYLSKNLKPFFYYLFYIYINLFYVLRILLFLKAKINIFFAVTENKTSFSLYKKIYSNLLVFSTFNILLKKLFYLLKLRVLTYKKRLLNVLNCYIKFTRHNIFITVTSALNVPLLIYSSGKSGYGGKTKFKVSAQAAAKSASLIVKLLNKKKLIKNLVVFIVSNRLFDKRIKAILSIFSQKGLKISYIVPQLQRYVGGVRQKKIRRV